MRVKGTAAYVPDRQRRQVGGSAYTLVREPNNAHDPNAVAVLGREGRKVGYVSAARAAILAPLLDQLGADGYRVAGADATEYSVKLWVDIPKVDAMRTFVKSMIG
ncbi:hypothetical protein E3O41_02375 [Microbacterium sediminis]|nr:hypothetical protein E3O41_02375 [Microbacterium sediminis]